MLQHGETANREKKDGDFEMAIMGAEGDTKIVWSKDNDSEVENARETYYRLRAKNFLPFKVNKSGDKGEQLSDFDPNVECCIFIPQMKGG